MVNKKDFFISYNKANRDWAEWIAWQLEDEGYSLIIQAWDFHPGCNFIKEMDNATRLAERTIAVLSPDYMKSKFTQVEWNAAFAKDPSGQTRKLLTVRVEDFIPDGLLGQVVYIDLVNCDEDTAKQKLINGVSLSRRKPVKPPIFPGQSKQKPSFPNQVIGHCIRCGTDINYDPNYPLCNNCYSIWVQYRNPGYHENYCHSCGLGYGTSYNMPLCRDCYRARPF